MSAYARAEPPIFKSSPEWKYAKFLDLRKHAGEIIAWGYEELRFKLGRVELGSKRDQWFTPDFWVLLLDREVQFHEVKGRMREAARVRLGVLKKNYPFRVFLVTGDGGRDGLKWDVKEI